MRAVPAPDQTTTFNGAWNQGVYSLGGSKAILERAVVRFDVLGSAYAGRALTPADVITAADLVLNVVIIPGTAGYACQLDRVTRPGWDYLTADWIEWAAGNNWTAAGGDVAGSPLAYNAPSALGDYTIGGLDALVIDAIANRAGALIMRSRTTSEADDGQTRYFTANGIGVGVDPTQQPRLVVTYEGQEPAPVDLPDLRTLGGSRGAPAARPAAAGAPAATPKGARPHGR
jgi:hypothetical protein